MKYTQGLYADKISAIHAAQTHSEGRALVIVRVPKNDELSLTTALDAGASGIVIPHVESAQEVKDMIKEMYYRTSQFPRSPLHPTLTNSSSRGPPFVQSMDLYARSSYIVGALDKIEVMYKVQ